MPALTVALLGASQPEVQLFSEALRIALKAGDPRVVVVLPGNAPAVETNLDAFDVVLLMSVQAPAKCNAEKAPSALEADDLAMRARLALGAVSYGVLYGTHDERLTQALNSVERLLPPSAAGLPQNHFSGGAKQQPWVWMCDKCSDPHCEHRLLTALLAQRADRHEA